MSREGTDSDILPPAAPSYIERGTVGWSDSDQWYEKGDGSNDGTLLVRVTLYIGRNQAKRPRAGVADGYQIVCQIGITPYRIPPKGTQVVIAIPGGDHETHGNGVIIATIEPNPTIQLEEDRVVMDFGADTHVVIKGKSVTLQDTLSPACWISTGTPRSGGPRGISLLSEAGAGFRVEGANAGGFATGSGGIKSLLQLSPTEATLTLVGIGVVTWKTGGCMVFANEPLPIKAPMVLCGPAAAAGNALLFLLSGVPTRSTTCFGSP